MTALNWIINNDYIVVSTDTLATLQNKQPYMYVNKIFPVPHLRLVICGTGSHKLLTDWYIEVQTKILSRDFDFVNLHAQRTLAKLNESLPKNSKSTIYHFTYDEKKQGCVGFIFRSEKNFECEEIPNGLATRPPLSSEFVLETNSKAETDQDYFIEIMKEQKRLDDISTNSEKVGIGGEIQFLFFSPNRLIHETIYRFESYDSDFQIMLNGMK